MPRLGSLLLTGLLVAAPAVEGQEAPLPSSHLSVRIGERWRTWWTSSEAPAGWPGIDSILGPALHWRSTAPGVEWAEARLAGIGEARRIRLIVVRLDPRRVRFRLDTAYAANGAPAWSVDRAGPEVLFAVNAGQFPRALPWGWVVLNGWEYLGPRPGPLSTGVAFDSLGMMRWIPGDSLASRRIRRGAVTAFQSYPTLLAGGVVPEPLRAQGRGVDLHHRDARAAIGQTRDGRLLVALTRFDGAGGVLDFVPFGLTTPEMAAIMGALGACDAVLLDGGISSQILIRDGATTRSWKGIRRVPLGLVAVAR